MLTVESDSDSDDDFVRLASVGGLHLQLAGARRAAKRAGNLGSFMKPAQNMRNQPARPLPAAEALAAIQGVGSAAAAGPSRARVAVAVAVEADDESDSSESTPSCGRSCVRCLRRWRWLRTRQTTRSFCSPSTTSRRMRRSR